VPEINRSRDVIVFVKGETITVTLDDVLVTEGWSGGTGVQWLETPSDEFVVTRTDGNGSGFLLWGSNEVPDEYTSMTRNQPVYRFGVLCAGGWMISTTSFETHTWTSRQGGPLVPINYTANDRLVFSLRGLWTKEDEWTLSGDGRAPNLNYVGAVVQAPSPVTNNYMTVQVIL